MYILLVYERELSKDDYLKTTTNNNYKAMSTRIRKFVKTQIFFTNTACVHTYPAYFTAVSGNF